MMKHYHWILLLISFQLLCLGSAFSQEMTPADYVNPLVGSESTFALSAGNTYPAIARPWGMNFWTPQTGKMGDGWQYVYTSNKIRGFKQTHQPSPWINDYGQFSLMPVTGSPVIDEEKRASWFSHKGEEVHPWYYKVYLADYDVVTEFTPTERAAMFRFTFPEGNSYIIADAFDKGSSVTIDPSLRRITGYTTKNSGGVPSNFHNYFVIEFDKPFTYTATFSGSNLQKDVLKQSCDHAGAVIGFKTHKGEIVHARVASSFISEEQALINLKELGDHNFDILSDMGKKAWNEVLNKIEISGGSYPDKCTFYSCLYRSLLFPRSLYEVNATGKIIHYSPYNGQVLDGYMFTDTGFWDTFRCLFPFLNLMYPTKSKEMQEGLLNAYRESGFFPEWASPGHRDCMVGNNSASILTDAWIKGIHVDDTETLWNGIVHGTNSVMEKVHSTGRYGYEYYNKLGYVPYDVKINESVARTLEYAYDDWCIWRLGTALERPRSERAIYAQRALNYKNVFDSKSNLMRGRNKNGKFQEPFSPLKWGDAFTEGNSWHYTWSVFHDPAGLMKLMGGREKFVEMLDSIFVVPPIYDDSYYGQVIHEIREMTVMNMGNYAHGNQPVQHVLYMYDYAGEPWKAQMRIREVMNRFYSCTPDGYCGDEDNGQTSAWYVFSALGFYPVAPGTTQYAIGSPLFEKVMLHFENGKNLLINAKGNSRKNVYVDKIMMAGKEYSKNYFEHFDLLNGGVIEMTMSDRPNLKRGTKKSDYPYSFSDR